MSPQSKTESRFLVPQSRSRNPTKNKDSAIRMPANYIKLKLGLS